MSKKLNIGVRSLGAEAKTPRIKDLAAWAGKQRKVACDLISYQLENSLPPEKKVDVPCTGGLYYGNRILSSIYNINKGFLTGEPAAVPEIMMEDASRIGRARKHTWVALPAPSALGIEDNYYNDREDYYGEMSGVYRHLMRAQRDRGVAGHVLIGERFDPIEREELAGKKVFFFSPEGGSKVLSQILEVQDRVAVPAGKLPHLLVLMDEYDVRQLTVVDAGPKDFALAAEHFDAEDLMAGGYCRDDEKKYWEDIAGQAYLMV